MHLPLVFRPGTDASSHARPADATNIVAPGPLPAIGPAWMPPERDRVGPRDVALREAVRAFVAAPTRDTQALDAPARTHVVVVLDASSSMLAGKALTIAGFNQQVDIVREQTREAASATVSLLVFNETVSPTYLHQPVQRLTHLDDALYRPRGSTALYDAVGAAIEAALAAPGVDEPGAAVLVAVFTDGEENASRLHSGPALAECVRALQDTGRFTFTLMGPRERLHELADALTLERGNVAGFDAASLVDRERAMTQMTQATATYMTLRATGASAATDLYAAAKEAPERGSAPV